MPEELKGNIFQTPPFGMTPEKIIAVSCGNSCYMLEIRLNQTFSGLWAMVIKFPYGLITVVVDMCSEPDSVGPLP